MLETPCRGTVSYRYLYQRRLSWAALTFILALSPLLAARPVCAQTLESHPASAPGVFVRAGTIGDVLASWEPKIHLYVLGDVGLEDATLQELAAWLGDRHWTVLLVKDATGQTYTDVDGQAREGEDAIKYGTGQGIPRRPGFLAQVNARSKEPDGAILTIVLAQRALFYTGSQAQDSRSFGEDAFRGNLDRWAIQAMRSGSDVLSAVRDTIVNVDAQVDAAIDREIQAAREHLDAARNGLTRLEEAAHGLLAAYPRLSGPLARPDLPALRRKLAAAEASLTDDPKRASQAADEVQNEVQALVQAIGEYSAFAQSLAAAKDRLAGLERRERAVLTGVDFAAGRQALAAASDLYAKGIPGYAERLAAAESRLSTADEQISAAETWAAVWRGVLLFLLVILAAALLWVGAFLNRRRRGAKREAEALLAAWRAALDKKLEVLCGELEQRVARFVGPESGEGKRPWAGETLRLAGQIRADIGSLSILWISAGSVLEKAEVLIRAKGLGAVYNFFFSGSYSKGITLLKDEPVPFDPADGLPKLFGVERTWRDDLLGDLASYQPFRKSLPEIVQELDLRAARAAEMLDRVEASLVQGPGTLEETAERIRQIESRRDEIERAGSADGLFGIPAVFTVAMPAAADALAQARALFPTDPVAALKGDGERARRIAQEAAQLSGLVAAVRHGALPAVDAAAAALRSTGIGTGWIEAERIRLSDDAGRLAEQTAAAPIEPGIEELALGLAGLAARTERAIILSKVLDKTARPEMRRVDGVVVAARGELGSALGLPPDRLLREEGADPSERLRSAAGQAETAQAALGEGGLDAGAAALKEAARLTAEAAVIVAATREAFAAQAATVEERRAETGRVEALLPEHALILAGIQDAFAPSVLALRADDPAHPGANATLADNLEESRAHVGLAHEKLERAIAAFRDGRLLAAAALLREVKGHQEFTLHRLEEIAERRARLERTVASNRSLLETLESRVREDETAVAGDPRAMAPTVAAFVEGRRRVEQGSRLVEAAPGDPLLAEDELLAAQVILAEVHDQRAPSDRLRYAEAEKSVEAAARQLAAAGELARRAAGDGIPDSPQIVEGAGALESLTAAQGQAKESLSVQHSDWNALDAEADRIAAEATRWVATLTGEFAAAERAVGAVSEASACVRQASSWRGSYGISITSSPGSDALSVSRSLIEQGRYEEAWQKASDAHRAASEAIRDAELAVVFEDQRREQERQHQAHASSVIASSFESGTSSSGSSGWVDSSSGSGSSSYGSSSSGSGESGW